MCPEYDQCIENTWLFPGNILYRPLVECPAVISVATGGHQSCIWSNRHTHIYTHALCRQILTDSLSSHFVRLLEVRVRASMWYFVLTTSCFTLAAPPQGCRHNYNLPVMSASGDAGLGSAAGGRVILEGRLSVSHWASLSITSVSQEEESAEMKQDNKTTWCTNQEGSVFTRCYDRTMQSAWCGRKTWFTSRHRICLHLNKIELAWVWHH